MKISEALKKAKTLIAPLDAEVLLAFALKKSREQLITAAEQKISPTLEKTFFALVARRAKNEPLAYLTGKKEFYSLEFAVSPAVLIPRPETEAIVDIIRKNNPSTGTIIDIGTGSGCIAIALAKHCPLPIVAVDISDPALAIARSNAAKHGVSEQITFLKSNLLEKVNFTNLNPPFVFATNLPYIPENDDLMSDVRDFEPPTALFGGTDGLTLYRRLFAEIGTRKIPFRLLVLEADPRQKEDIKRLSADFFPEKTLRFSETDRIGAIFS